MSKTLEKERHKIWKAAAKFEAFHKFNLIIKLCPGKFKGFLAIVVGMGVCVTTGAQGKGRNFKNFI